VVALTNDNVSILGALLDEFEGIKIPKHNFDVWISSLEFGGRRAEQSCSSNVWELLEYSFKSAPSNVPGCTSSRSNQPYSTLEYEL
jgi:hypothetical protein